MHEGAFSINAYGEYVEQYVPLVRQRERYRNRFNCEPYMIPLINGINIAGCIATEGPVRCPYVYAKPAWEWDYASRLKNNEQPGSQIEYVLEKYFGGVEELNSIDAIKGAIKAGRPVWSLSFTLKDTILQDPTYRDVFRPEEAALGVEWDITWECGKMHPLLLVGWETRATGSVWLFRDFRHKRAVARNVLTAGPACDQSSESG